MHDKRDKAIAHKALNIARGLSSADKAVAGALIDHFSNIDGQCDPSIARLATLLGIDEKTVRRATNELCGAHKLFVRASHGGKSSRASYTPQWSEFRAIVSDWDRRMRTGSGPDDDEDNRAEMSGCTGQKCPSTQGKNVLQTYYKNPSKKPISLKPPSETAEEPIERSSSELPSHGLLNGKDEKSIDRNYLSRERGPTGASHAEAAWSAAEYRLDNAIAEMDGPAKVAVWAWLDEASLKAAIRAETQRRGGGMAFIGAAMRMDRLKNVEARHDQVH